MDILWWHWIVLGLLLAAAEMASAGGFYIIFFGIGAIVVGVLSALGLAGPVWLQFGMFAAISVTSLAVFRNRVVRWLQPDPQAPAVDAIVGEVSVALDDLAPGQVGRVELRGTQWSARNLMSSVLPRGTRCRVVRVDGLTVDVVAEGARS